MKLLELLAAFIKFFPLWAYAIITLPLYFYYYYFRRQTYYKGCGFAFKLFLSILGIRVSLHDAGPSPKSRGKYLIVANHQSYIDILAVGSIFSSAFIQRPIPYIPGFSWHFGRLSLIIERDHPVSIIKAVRYVKKVTLEQNTPVTIFPESTRSLNGEIGEIRLGAATIVKSLTLPVLPVAILNSGEILPKGSINPKRGTILMEPQPLIEKEFIKTHSAEEISQEIKQRLQNGMDNLARKRRETA